MPQKQSLNTVRQQFRKRIESAKKIHECSTDLKRKNQLNPTHAHKIIELAFLSIVSAWEEFLGATFIRYLCASTSPSGYTPSLNPGMQQQTLGNAVKALYKKMKGRDFKEGEDHLSLTNIDWLIKTANHFFVDGEPYATILTDNKPQLSTAQIARNRVAHDFEDCKIKFNQEVKKHRGKLRSGYSVGLFLLGSPQPVFLPATEEAHQTDLFTAYANLYAKLALEIAP